MLELLHIYETARTRTRLWIYREKTVRPRGPTKALWLGVDVVMAMKLPHRVEPTLQEHGHHGCGQAQAESQHVGTTNANYNKQAHSQQEVPDSDSEDGEPGGFARGARGQEMHQKDQAFHVESREGSAGENRPREPGSE